MSSPARKPKKDRTSFTISVLLHLALIAGVVFWAWKSGKLEQMRQAVLQYVRSEKKEEKQDSRPLQQKSAPSAKLPPINQGMPPTTGSGTRRAVAAQAPAAAGGESFFQDTRRQEGGPSTSGGAPPSPSAPKLTVVKPPTSAGPYSAFSKEASKPSTVASVLQSRQQSAAAQDAISTEQISRSGASDAAAVVSKITGASVVEGKFVVVRGLSDRYNTTTLNGAEIPTADPYRKAAQLDLFPSAMIDRVIVNKTFTPDQPGGFAGGAVNIITRSFPDQFHFRMNIGTEYNTTATFNKDFLTYDGGGTDWLGFDDGTRALPKNLEQYESPDDIPRPPGSGAPQSEADDYEALLKSFKSPQMGPTRDAPPANSSFGASFGDTLYFLERRLGYTASLSYDRKFTHFEGTSERWSPEESTTDAQPKIDKQYSEVRSIDEVLWASAVNLAYELSPDHILNFNFVYSQNGEDSARQRIGFSTPEQFNGSEDSVTYLNTLHYIERQVHAFQLRGQHELPELNGTRMDWLAALANTSQDEPDLRMFNFKAFTDGTTDFGGSSGVPEPGFPTRYFRALNEDNQTYKLDFTVPITDLDDWKADLKFGGYYNNSERQFEENTYSFRRRTVDYVSNPLDYPNQFLDPANLEYTAITNRNGQVTYRFDRELFSELGNSLYEGEQDIYAGYLMPDLQLGRSLRLTGGVRYETTDLQVDSTARNLGNTIFSASLEAQDVLPSAGATWSVLPNMSLRVSYGGTLARPTYREIAKYRSYDVTGDEILEGNPDLRRSLIDNYDLRWEWFPQPGEVIAVGGFYKDITDPIEKIALNRIGDTTTFTNFPNAIVYGLEIEARVKLDFLLPSLNPFSAGINYAWIYSEVENFPGIAAEKEKLGLDGKTRPLYDQSDYTLNADISYENAKSGTRCSLIFSQSGERLYLVNPTGFDVYEQPAGLLDFVLSQDITRNLSLKFSAKNLLDPEFRRIYGRAGELDDEVLYSSYRRGRTFGVSLNYSF